MWIHKASITAHGPFPIDMLRYDHCWPTTGEDAAKIEESKYGHGVTVMVTCHSDKRASPWTIARWQSFNCICNASQSFKS